MSVINVENLTFAYPSSFDNIFEDVSFTIDTDWKLGFVGRNGRGKTTFLKLLMGKFEYSGKITASVSFDYFPYRIENTDRTTLDILYEVCPTAEDWEFMRELSLLDVDCDVLYREFATLSNGERTKVLLAALFLREGHFLLIDEPTNHLDHAAREVVAEYLRRKRSFILVSHDRAFLDRSVDHILSINRTTIEVMQGSFSTWFDNRRNRDNFELARNEQLKRDIKRLEESSKRSAKWSNNSEKGKFGTTNSGVSVDRGFVGHRAEKMMKRAKSLEARQNKAIEEKASLLKDLEVSEKLAIHPLRYHSDRMVELRDVSIQYDGRTVNSPLTFAIMQGDRIALDGINGCGKSSILKLICGQRIDYIGKLNLASSLAISYVSQDTSHLRGSLSDYAHEFKIDESLFKAILRKLDFERVQFEKDMSDFSEGQKKKVMLARSLCEEAHLYIWDEPLNYIDIYSRLQIEQLLSEFTPTMIFVEHDSSFRSSIATRIVSIENR